MALKKFTPPTAIKRRRAADNKTVTPRVNPATKSERRKAMDAIKARIEARRQAAIAEEAKKATDGTFEVTEESFKELIKEAVYEFSLQHGLIQKGEQEPEGEKEPEGESEGEPEGEPEGEKESEDSPENTEFMGFGEEEEEEKDGEDEDLLGKILNDPVKKDALKNLLKDQTSKKVKDAASVFASRYEAVVVEKTPVDKPIKNRYN